MELNQNKQTEVRRVENEKNYWAACNNCKGRGKTRQKLSIKARKRYQNELDEFKNSTTKTKAPTRPKASSKPCTTCEGTGIIPSKSHPIPDSETMPHVAIIGGGIGGAALAIACLHRGIPYTLYERDDNFDTRSQGYGLTLQQASKAIAALGILSLKDGVISNRHLVHTVEGIIIGEWGMRKWIKPDSKKTSKKTNIHIARQSLRLALLEQLNSKNSIQWGHKLIDLKERKDSSVDLKFLENGKTKTARADLVVGADGIRSSVRKLIIGETISPLRHLDCIVILGVCSLESLNNIDNSLLDSKTVFQTANGNERIYVMPFTSDTVMWQLSFPMSEKHAKSLSEKGAKALKEEAIKRTQWHFPIPQIINATEEAQISGYPVYDRELLDPELLKKCGAITLIGDAAHPMSPFKGQGANQALLDALSLARKISIGCNASPQWRKAGIRESVLNDFEADMIKRSASKVKDSAAAAKFLHSEIALHKVNEPRGRVLKRKNNSNNAE